MNFVVKYVRWLPSRVQGFTPCPARIYLNERHPPRDQASMIVHEKVHGEQMLRDGWLTWVRRYFFNGKARWEYEAEAYARQWQAEFGLGIADMALFIDASVQKLYPLYYQWWMPGERVELDYAVERVVFWLEGENAGLR